MIHLNKIILLPLIAIVTLLATTEAHGQTPTIRGHFSRDSIEVGDRVEYIIDIETD